MDLSFEGKTAVVTGASEGIGFAQQNFSENSVQRLPYVQETKIN